MEAPKTAKEVHERVKEAKRIYGKGWRVVESHNRAEKKFLAIRWNGSTIGRRDTLEEAVLLAISEAFRDRKINWPMTNRWLKTRGVHIDMQWVPKDHKRKPRKGWGVMISRGVYEARVRVSSCKYVYIATRPTRKSAIRTAIAAAKERGCYDREASNFWLRQNGYPELIEK